MPVTRPDPAKVQVFRAAADFRRWLEEHHASANELWVGYYKKRAGKHAMTYPEAVEEALCFGWIDGVGYTVDDELHTNRFTPRRRGSSWSAVNIARIAELQAAGRLHAAGLRAFEERDRRKDAQYSYETVPRELPPELEARMKADAAAWQDWSARPAGYRRTAVAWVLSAKRAETRDRRLAELIEASSAGRPIKPLSYGRNGDR
jgi:uncharacterized protein YdeI (YjbR/CyaY-like superfamily)